jgi:hypothetical protein
MRVYLRNPEAIMTKTYDIQVHMEVVDANGQHVGVVDHLEGVDRIKLTKGDARAGGRHHYIFHDWVDRVEEKKVHLNRPVEEVMAEWEAAE